MVGSRAELSADIEPVRARQHEIEKHEIEAVRRDHLYRNAAVALAPDLEASFAKMQRHHLGDGVVVFHEQEGAHVHEPCTVDL